MVKESLALSLTLSRQTTCTCPEEGVLSRPPSSLRWWCEWVHCGVLVLGMNCCRYSDWKRGFLVTGQVTVLPGNWLEEHKCENHQQGKVCQTSNWEPKKT